MGESVYVEKLVTFHPIGNGQWNCFVWDIPPNLSERLYRLRIAVPLELLDPLVEAEVLPLEGDSHV